MRNVQLQVERKNRRYKKKGKDLRGKTMWWTGRTETKAKLQFTESLPKKKSRLPSEKIHGLLP
jgi:hypothetical protein